MIQVQTKYYKYFYMDTFGKRLKLKREAKGLTQDELAAKVGKASKQAISNWENGNAEPSFATRFLRHGGRIEVLQKLLGHADITTTMIYVHVDTERMRTEINLLT